MSKRVAVSALILVWVVFLLIMPSCAGESGDDTHTPIPVKDMGILWADEPAPDDIMPVPGGGPAYRANVHQQGVENPWPPIEVTDVYLGSGSNEAHIYYRNHIETKSGENRNNVIKVIIPNKEVRSLSLYTNDIHDGITLTDGMQWTGPSARASVLVIEIAPDFAPGEFRLEIGLEINGEDYGTVPCTIEVLLDKVVPRALSLEIQSPQDEAELDTNLVKVTGTVSDPTANVTLNYGTTQTGASVSDNGSFYGWVDLPKGASMVEVVATKGKERVAKAINITFKPPLAVWVDGPPSVAPNSANTVVATLTGYVTNPEAKVTVSSIFVDASFKGNVWYTPIIWDVVINSTMAEASPDGFYSAKMQLDFKPDADIATHYVLKAEAVRGTEANESYTSLFWILQNGEFGSVPKYKRTGPTSELPTYPRTASMSLKAGDEKSVPLLLNVNKDVIFQSIFSSRISRVDKEYSEVMLPLPEGLHIYLSPSTFTVWPKVDYQPDLVVETTAQVLPGEYWFYAEYLLGDVVKDAGWFNILITS